MAWKSVLKKGVRKVSEEGRKVSEGGRFCQEGVRKVSGMYQMVTERFVMMPSGCQLVSERC